MTTWRWPTAREVRADYGYLRNALPDDVARRIAGMPIVVTNPPAPFALRRDAWLYRTDRLLGRIHR